MKNKLLVIRHYLPWLFLLIGMDAFFTLLLWLAEADAFRSLVILIVMASVMVFTMVFLVLNHLEKKKIQAFKEFLFEPDLVYQEKLCQSVSALEAEYVRMLGAVLREQKQSCAQALEKLSDYEEYVESWAHETKTPVSLLTMVLDNRRDEMSVSVAFKLDYVRSQIQENINQMLYYARLKSIHKDYLFEEIDLAECINEVLDDYKPLLEEKKFEIYNKVSDVWVFTDRRGILFLLSQVISNVLKYSKETPVLNIYMTFEDENKILHICDNGMGVQKCDLPYIFEKGFTGNSADNRKKATGMGLYLSQKIAQDLAISLEAFSEWEKGFEMRICFPKVDK